MKQTVFLCCSICHQPMTEITTSTRTATTSDSSGVEETRYWICSNPFCRSNKINETTSS